MNTRSLIILGVQNNRTLVEIAQDADLDKSWIAFRIREICKQNPELISEAQCAEYQIQYNKIAQRRINKVLYEHDILRAR